MLTFDIVALAKGEIEDTDSILTPESLCSAPPLTQVQKDAGQIAVDDLRSQLSVTNGGTALVTPLAAPINLSRVSRESDRIVKTFTGIPTPGGTDVGKGINLITLTAALTVVIILSKFWAVISNVCKGC